MKSLSAASKALEILKKYLSQRLLNTAQEILEHESRHPREKLMALWEWVKSFQYNDAQVIQQIKADLTNLPTVDNFKEAVENIHKMDSLQRELITMEKGMSNLEMIILHTGKLQSHHRYPTE